MFIYYPWVCAGVHLCDGMHLEARGQVAQVSSLLLYDFGVWWGVGLRPGGLWVKCS